MKLSTLSLWTVAALAVPAYAWPGMKSLDAELRALAGTKRHTQTVKRATDERKHDGDDGGDGGDDHDTPELIGDLKDGITSDVGQLIADILLSGQNGESDEAGYRIPGSLKSKACRADTCCVWAHVSAALTKAFKGPTGRCNDDARAAIRLGFHDAGTWSKSLAEQGQDFGGADGSILLSGVEISRPENNGLQDIIRKTQVWAKKYGVGVADLIQFMAVHAAVTCPLGPRVRAFVGREDSSKPAPDGLLPGVNQPASELIDLFLDKTIGPHDLVALVGAHSTSRQFLVNPHRAGAPQDSTPGVWDTLFYVQTLFDAPRAVFRFASDIALSRHPRTRPEWKEFAHKNAQEHWNKDYAAAYVRLSLLGVNNINDLTECTKVLPASRDNFPGADRPMVFQ